MEKFLSSGKWAIASIDKEVFLGLVISAAEIIAKVISCSSSNPDIPATALYDHQNVTVILDEKAAAMLPTSVKPKTTLLSSKNIYTSPKIPEATKFPVPVYESSTPAHVGNFM